MQPTDKKNKETISEHESDSYEFGEIQEVDLAQSFVYAMEDFEEYSLRAHAIT